MLCRRPTVFYETTRTTVVCSNRDLYTVSQKNCANLFLSELRQISANCWQKDGKEAIIMRDVLIFHLI